MKYKVSFEIKKLSKLFMSWKFTFTPSSPPFLRVNQLIEKGISREKILCCQASKAKVCPRFLK